MSCSSKDDDETITNGKAKYEITGNYTGKLSALTSTTSDNGGESGNNEVNSLPWTKEVDVKGRTSLGIGVRSDLTSAPGVAGQKITVKMYYNGNEVKSTTATANSEGIINCSTIV